LEYGYLLDIKRESKITNSKNKIEEFENINLINGEEEEKEIENENKINIENDNDNYKENNQTFEIINNELSNSNFIDKNQNQKSIFNGVKAVEVFELEATVKALFPLDDEALLLVLKLNGSKLSLIDLIKSSVFLFGLLEDDDEIVLDCKEVFGINGGDNV